MIGKKETYEPVKTVLVITTGFILLFFITNLAWSLYLAMIVSILGLLSNAMAKKISFVWLKLASLLNLIMPNIILSIIFFLILTPIALLSRMFKKNQLRLKNSNKSLFIQKDSTFQKEHFEKPW